MVSKTGFLGNRYFETSESNSNSEFWPEICSTSKMGCEQMEIFCQKAKDGEVENDFEAERN